MSDDVGSHSALQDSLEIIVTEDAGNSLQSSCHTLLSAGLQLLRQHTGYMNDSHACSQLHPGTLPGFSLVPAFFGESACLKCIVADSSWGGITMDLVSSLPPFFILQAFCLEDSVAGIGYYLYVAGLDALGPTDFSDPIWASAPL